MNLFLKNGYGAKIDIPKDKPIKKDFMEVKRKTVEVEILELDEMLSYLEDEKGSKVIIMIEEIMKRNGLEFDEHFGMWIKPKELN